ncbi:MAG: restriction endonuclease subunit S [Gemmatimonadota bacterium]
MRAGLVDHHALGGKLIPAAVLIGYKRLSPGEIVMNRMRAAAGLFAVAKSSGLVSPDYATFRSSPKLNAHYAVALFKTTSMMSVFRLESRGLGTGESGFLRLYSDRFGMLPIPIPPVEEQAAIVQFLDWASGRLEGAIRAKRKVIALLGEQKQAIIHRAVTRGLDSSLILKPTGVPWLGDIPANWETWRLGRSARIGNGSTPSRGRPAYWNGGTYPWLNSSQVNRGFIDSADQFVTAEALRECHLPRVPVGSVLVAITGQGKTRGTSALLGMEATINQHIAFVTPRPSLLLPHFLHLSLTAAYGELRAMSEDSGSTKGAITCEGLKRFTVAVPPLAEQATLIDRIETETKALNTTMSRLETETGLLREYRARLIADVVTGKLDVREAAARLPDEAPLDSPSDDTDILDDPETADEEAVA